VLQTHKEPLALGEVEHPCRHHNTVHIELRTLLVFVLNHHHLVVQFERLGVDFLSVIGLFESLAVQRDCMCFDVRHVLAHVVAIDQPHDNAALVLHVALGHAQTQLDLVLGDYLGKDHGVPCVLTQFGNLPFVDAPKAFELHTELLFVFQFFLVLLRPRSDTLVTIVFFGFALSAPPE